jgi:hypothetical protein
MFYGILSFKSLLPRRPFQRIGVAIGKSSFPADVAFTHRARAWVTTQLTA